MAYTNLIQGMIIDILTGALKEAAASIEAGADPDEALYLTAHRLQLGWKCFKDGTHEQLSASEIREGKLIGDPIKHKKEEEEDEWPSGE